MAGRPPLRIGHHGSVNRIQVGEGQWVARCRFRDTDGVTRIVERRGPAGDKYGKAAEDALMEVLTERRTTSGEINGGTKVIDLIRQHIDRLEEDGRAIRTIDTYNYCATKLGKQIAGLRVEDCTPARVDAAIRKMRNAHKTGMAIHAKTLLQGALHLAVMANALPSNPVRDVSPIRLPPGPKGARALTAEELPILFVKLGESATCQRYDLVDPVTLLIATGIRRAELLGLGWPDFDPIAGTIAIGWIVVRKAGEGLRRVPKPKTEAARRTIALPQFAISMLENRRAREWWGEQTTIFPSSTGTLRDPDNFNDDWAAARKELGLEDITSHSFRKGVATLIDEAGLSARIGADHLGHSRVSETQDTYWARGRVHKEVANALDNAVAPRKPRRKR